MFRCIDQRQSVFFNAREMRGIQFHISKITFSTGLLPWNAMPGKACGMTLASICKTKEVSETTVTGWYSKTS